MADTNKKTVEVPEDLLLAMQKQIADLQIQAVNSEAKSAGLEEMLTKASVEGSEKPGLRKKKDFEPAFRTVRLHEFPIGGDFENKGIVVGWTKRGAYQEVDRSGVAPQIVNYIDVIFLGQETTKDGKIKAEKVRWLDLMNSPQVVCKILSKTRKDEAVATGEEINVSVYDPQHGLVSTGDTIDGYVTVTNETYTIEVPGIKEPVTIDAQFVNR